MLILSSWSHWMWLQHSIFSTLISWVICFIVHQFTRLFMHSIFRSFIIYCFVHVYGHLFIRLLIYPLHVSCSCCCGWSAEGCGCEKRVRILIFLLSYYFDLPSVVIHYQLESCCTQHYSTLQSKYCSILRYTALHHSTILIMVAISWAIFLV